MSLVIHQESESLIVKGDLTLINIESLNCKNFGLDFDLSSIKSIDLSQVGKCSDIGLSLLIEWKKLIINKGCVIDFISMPDSLNSLIDLYGVNELFYNS